MVRIRARAVTLAVAFAVAVGTGLFAFAGAAVSTAVPSFAKAQPSITKAHFGSVGGQDVDIYTLTNSRRIEVKIITYGGIIESAKVPDKSKRFANVKLGFSTLDDYVNLNGPFPKGGPYFGCITGRYANWIANGQFQLNSTTYQLPINNPPNSLHGGIDGFDNKVWAATIIPADFRQRRAQAALHQSRRRGGIPGDAVGRRDVHALERERDPDRVPRHERIRLRCRRSST